MAVVFYDDGEADDEESESSVAMCLVVFELVIMLTAFYFVFTSRHVA